YGGVTDLAWLPADCATITGAVANTQSSSFPNCEAQEFLGVTPDLRLLFSERLPNSQWTPFEDVASRAGDPGDVSSVDSAMDGNDLHICVVASGNILHPIRRATGYSDLDVTWVPFNHVYPGCFDTLIPTPFSDVGCAVVNGELHVCAVGFNGSLWHSIRSRD